VGAYLDTGALVPLYVTEAFSEAITAEVERHGEPVPVNSFHRLELESALRLKVFRGEIAEDLCRTTLRKIESHLEAGMLRLRPVDWVAAIDNARRISRDVTQTAGCRTLDLIHAAIAAQWKCTVFVTGDERQIEAARIKGFTIVDLRELHRRHKGDSPAQTAVKEARRPYSGRRRVARA
jgi:predicted nucleic acid-binding protein